MFCSILEILDEGATRAGQWREFQIYLGAGVCWRHEKVDVKSTIGCWRCSFTVGYQMMMIQDGLIRHKLQWVSDMGADRNFMKLSIPNINYL